MTVDVDAIIVGAGPNGLAAANMLAEAGRSVRVYEAAERIGGGTRTAELTLPGFHHDVCSAIHPFGVASPVFQRFNLEQHGLDWAYSPVELAHPFDDGSVALLKRSIPETGESLGVDAGAWAKLMQPYVDNADRILNAMLYPHDAVKNPVLMATFGLHAIRSAKGLVDGHFSGRHARALFGGIAAHSFLRLDQSPSGALGLVLGFMGHSHSWPMARGGSQAIADALAAHLRSLGGEIITGHRVHSVDDLPDADAMLFDVTPRQLIRIAGHRFPEGYRRRLSRFRYGPGVFKMDFALDGPVPWKSSECMDAATVHLGGTFEEIAEAEASVLAGKHPERPFVLVAQQSLFDNSRAPDGKQTVWAYCHVPHGSTVDMSEHVEAQLERFAPGFRDRILARHVMNTGDMERYNANYIGGDISGGFLDLRQLFTRPVVRIPPYTTPDKRIYICSASTPPGGGVHGICGFHAARAALRRAW